MMKYSTRLVALLLLLGLSSATWAQNYDGYISSGGSNPNGRLYYKIVSGQANIVYPEYDGTEWWHNHTAYKPSGAITIPSSIYVSGNSYMVRKIGMNAFLGCTDLTSVSLPSTLWNIGSSAFKNCSMLDSVFMPSCNVIGDQAFYGCIQLSYINFPNSLHTIGDYAFYRCQQLTSANIPSVNSLGESAFARCRDLTSVTLGSLSGLTEIKNSTFVFCTSLASITIPNTVTSIGDNAFQNTAITSIVIPSSVTSIGIAAFASCHFLQSVSLPDGLSEINMSMFNGCISLSSVTIPNNVVSIRQWAFFGTAISSIDIPSSVTYIENKAFDSCVNLSSVNIHNPSVTLANDAFGPTGWNHFYCSLTSVTIGSNTVSVTANNTNDEVRGYVSLYIVNNSTVRLRTEGAYGYHDYTFYCWDDSNTMAERDVNISTNRTYTAFFKGYDQNIYSIRAQSSNPALGIATVNESSNTFAIEGDTVTLRAIPIGGSTFLHWDDIPVNAVTRRVRVTEDHIYTAVFAMIYTITATSNNAAMGTAYVDGESSMTVMEGDYVSLLAEANEGYAFIRWNDNDTNEWRNIFPTQNMNFIAYFAPLRTVTATSANPLMGQAFVNNSSEVITKDGSVVNLTAIPKNGYRFLRWNDGNTESERSVTVSGDMSFIAYFEDEAGPQGINDVSDDNFQIFVRNGQIIVTGAGGMEVRVYDLMGRNVTGAEIGSGVYFVQVGDSHARKVLVTR